MNFKQFLITVCFLIILFANTFAQQTVLVSGGNATGSGGSGSYSVGQVAYTSIISINGTVSQGVQHSYETIILDIDNVSDLRFSLSVYPNPLTESTQLKVENIALEGLSYKLYDSNSKLILNQKIIDKETIIPMVEISCGIYFLKVIRHEKELYIFELIQ